MAESWEQRQKRLRGGLEAAVAEALSADDARVVEAFEALSRARRPLGAVIASWGPVVWRRDRVRFRSLVLRYVSEGGIDVWGSRKHVWDGKDAVLDAWMAEVAAVRDAPLYRALHDVALGRDHRTSAARWQADLLARWAAFPDQADRAFTIEAFTSHWRLDEAAAKRLWSDAPDLTRAFVLAHLPGTAWGWGSRAERPHWKGLWAASEGVDDALFLGLYRRQVPPDRWKADVARWTVEIARADALCATLEAHHPVGLPGLAGPLIALLEARGRDAWPYVGRHLNEARPNQALAPMLALARTKSWDDIAGAIVAASPDLLGAELERLVADGRASDAVVEARVRSLIDAFAAGSSLPPLPDTTLVSVYRRFPALIRGPLAPTIGHWGDPVGLFDAAIAASDLALVDRIGARFLTRAWGGRSAVLAKLTAHYEALPEGQLPLRAAAILGAQRAFGVWSYGWLVRNNAFARLILERTAHQWLDHPDLVGDLLESPAITVQSLAWRVLAAEDPRASGVAARHLDLLLPGLLRRLHVATRRWVLKALENAAIDEEHALRIVVKAKDALDLPAERYPREMLIGLIGRLLHRYPTLRGGGEHPQVYRDGEAA